jgi:hypothetical protein
LRTKANDAPTRSSFTMANGTTIYLSNDEQAHLLYCMEKMKKHFSTDRDLVLFHGVRRKLRGASDLYANGVPAEYKRKR